jgi:hypothetical protein
MWLLYVREVQNIMTTSDGTDKTVVKLTHEQRFRQLKKKLERHYLRELELITEILSLDDKHSEKLYTWLKKECKSYAALGEVIEYARGRDLKIEGDG